MKTCLKIHHSRLVNSIRLKIFECFQTQATCLSGKVCKSKSCLLPTVSSFSPSCNLTTKLWLYFHWVKVLAMLVMMVPVPSHLFHWDRLVRQGQHLEVKCDILKFSCHVESVFMPDEHGSTSARQRSRKNPAMHFKIFKICQSRSEPWGSVAGATWNGVSRLACRMTSEGTVWKCTHQVWWSSKWIPAESGVCPCLTGTPFRLLTDILHIAASLWAGVVCP